MIQPGRKYSATDGYRYGFNGKENDNDVKGEGNQQDYGFRIYDPRLGRFLSVDPLTDEYPELTPYQFASNAPIEAIDLDGLERYHYTFTQDDQGKTVLTPMYDGKPQDFEEDKISLGFGGGLFGIFHTYKTVKNPRVEYVVHHQDSKKYYTEPGSLGQETFNYDETLTFSSYEEASKVSAYDFKETKEDIKVRIDASNKYNEAFLYAAVARSPLTKSKTQASETANKQSTAINNGNSQGAKENNSAKSTITYEEQIYQVRANVPYKRPNNSTTPAQRKAVNQAGAICATCGTTKGPFVADHKTPLAIEHISTGSIDKKKMRDLQSVQSQCEGCSNDQSKKVRQASQAANKIIKKRENGK